MPEFGLIIICIYRSPSGGFESFLGVLSNALSRIEYGRYRVLLTGDFNVAFGSGSTQTTQLCDLLSEFGLTTEFSGPTRNNRCLDNVFNNFNDSVNNITLDLLYSDHLGIETTFKLTEYALNKTKKVVKPITQTGLNAFYLLTNSL